MEKFLEIVIGVLNYFYFAYSLNVICRKLGVPNAGLCWIPILQLLQLFRAAEMERGIFSWQVPLIMLFVWPVAIFVPFLVPFVILSFLWIIFILFMVHFQIALRLKKSPWTLVMLITPFALFFWGYLAFT